MTPAPNRWDIKTTKKSISRDINGFFFPLDFGLPVSIMSYYDPRSRQSKDGSNLQFEMNRTVNLYLGLSVDVNLRSISVRQYRPAISRVESDRDATAGLRFKGECRLEPVFVENLSDLELVLFPTPKARFKHIDRTFALPIKMDFNLRNLRLHVFWVWTRILALKKRLLLGVRSCLFNFSNFALVLWILHFRAPCWRTVVNWGFYL